jgi:hypothetical protein
MIQAVRWNYNNQIGEDDLKDLLRHAKRLIGDPPSEKRKSEGNEKSKITREEDPDPKRSKGKKLSDFFGHGVITAEIYSTSIILINKSNGLSDKEKRLIRNLDAFLEGGLSKETFLDNWEIIMQFPEKKNSENTGDDCSEKIPASPKKKFCTSCGNAIKPVQVFCTSCGKKAN